VLKAEHAEALSTSVAALEAQLVDSRGASEALSVELEAATSRISALTAEQSTEECASKTLTRRLHEECDAVDRMREEVLASIKKEFKGRTQTLNRVITIQQFTETGRESAV